jgi:hypothetical protein
MHTDDRAPLLVSLARAGSIKCMKPRKRRVRWFWVWLRSRRDLWT